VICCWLLLLTLRPGFDVFYDDDVFYWRVKVLDLKLLLQELVSVADEDFFVDLLVSFVVG